MNALVLVQFLAYVATNAPELFETAKRLIDGFRTAHPEIADPPPPDAEAKVDTEVDELIRIKFAHDDEDI